MSWSQTFAGLKKKRVVFHKKQLTNQEDHMEVVHNSFLTPHRVRGISAF